MIEERILGLQSRMQIDEANVRIACHLETSPAFSVHIHLVTPGPDVVAEGRDHTLRAAIEKVMTGLEDRIGDRVERRRPRARAKLRETRRMNLGQNVR
jgi:ribosome-associated translation inhibitor RaiA